MDEGATVGTVEEETKKEQTHQKGCVLWVYSYIDASAPFGKRFKMEAFGTEEEALLRDKELEVGANKLNIIIDRRLAPVWFINGREEYSLFRKRLLKKAKKTDKKTKKNLAKARQQERDVRQEFISESTSL